MNKMLVEIIAPEEGQTESWAHLAPFGRFSYLKPSEDDPRKTGVQLLDAPAHNHLVEVFKDEVLIDREHLSVLGDDTTAQGWIQKIEVRGDGSAFEHGLWALVRWTDVGLGNLKNRRLRWLSPVWELDNDNRPIELDSAGLTNLARFKKNLKPVVNKDDLQPQGKDQPKMDWTKLLEALGLPADATPEQAVAAVAALNEKVTVANKAAEEAQSAALQTEAEKVADDNKDKIANKADFVKAYIVNKDNALAVLGCFKVPEPVKKTAICNKDDARIPASFKDAGGKVLNKADEYDAMSDGPEKTKFLRTHATAINDDRNAAVKQ